MAMADLMVKLGLDGSRFSAGVKSASNEVKNFGDRWGGAMKGIRTGLKFGGAALALAAISRIISKFQELRTIGEEQKAARWEILGDDQIENIEKAASAIDDLKTRFKTGWANLFEASGIMSLVTSLRDAFYLTDQLMIKGKSFKDAITATNDMKARPTPEQLKREKEEREQQDVAIDIATREWNANEKRKEARRAKELKKLKEEAALKQKMIDEEGDALERSAADLWKELRGADKYQNKVLLDQIGDANDERMQTDEDTAKKKRTRFDALIGMKEDVIGSLSPANAMQEVGLMMGSADKNAAVSKLEELVRINEDIRTLLQGNTPGGLE